MNKKKVILSIVLLLSLTAIFFIIPLIRRGETRVDTPAISETSSENVTTTETESEPTLELAELDFQGFEELEMFLKEEQIDVLKEQLTHYISLAAPEVVTVTFIAEGISYPNTYTLKMDFQLSDGSKLPVYYDLKTDTYSFTDDETVVETKKEVKYEKETDHTLPSYTPEAVESMQEGGFPDTVPSETTEVQP